MIKAIICTVKMLVKKLLYFLFLGDCLDDIEGGEVDLDLAMTSLRLVGKVRPTVHTDDFEEEEEEEEPALDDEMDDEESEDSAEEDEEDVVKDDTKPLQPPPPPGAAKPNVMTSPPRLPPIPPMMPFLPYTGCYPPQAYALPLAPTPFFPYPMPSMMTSQVQPTPPDSAAPSAGARPGAPEVGYPQFLAPGAFMPSAGIAPTPYMPYYMPYHPAAAMQPPLQQQQLPAATAAAAYQPSAAAPTAVTGQGRPASPTSGLSNIK